jgi:hypothetical protein
MEKYPQFDLTGFMTDNKMDFKEHPADGHLEVSICCYDSRCNEGNPDKEFKMWINEDKGTYICYRCGEYGSVVRLIMKIATCTFENALRVLKGKITEGDLNIFMFKLVDTENDIVMDYDEETTAKEVELPYSYIPITGPHPYLEERGVPWQIAKAMGWGISATGYTANRIIVPTFVNNRLVFWQARDMLNEKHEHWGDKKEYRKVLNPKGVSARHVLYNYDNAKDNKTIIITEGFMDCTKVGLNAVATNGTNIHAKQIELLRESKVETVTLLWDRDSYKGKIDKKTGKMKIPPAIKAGRTLKDFFQVKHAILPDSRDPGDYEINDKRLEEIILNAKEV